MGETRSERSARLSPKVLAISAQTIFRLEQTAGAALNDPLLRQIVDNLRRHPKTARQSVGRDRRKRRLLIGLVFLLVLVASFHRQLSSVMNSRRFIQSPRRRERVLMAARRVRAP